MAFNRIERIKQEYLREMASVLRTVKDPRMPSMVSVVAVDITKDLKYAKVYVSVMGSEKEKKDAAIVYDERWAPFYASDLV